MGAQRVKTNFDELEKSVAESTQEPREINVPERGKEEQEEINSRLAYRYEQNLTEQAKKIEERTRNMDPTKAVQAERLGMGFNSRTGASHSALSDMRVITQESSGRKVTASEPKFVSIDNDAEIDRTNRLTDFDEFFSALTTPYGNKSGGNKSRSDDFVVITEPDVPKRGPSRPSNNKVDMKPSTDGEAQRKFGGAKAISSDQYFRDSAQDDSVSFHSIKGEPALVDRKLNGFREFF